MTTKNGFKTIYKTIKDEIENNLYAAGSILPTESQVAARFDVSRPTITKVYNLLQEEGYVRKKKGYGTEVISHRSKKKPLFGLLLPGAGESEIFAIINDKLIEMSGNGSFSCLCEGASASNAKIRSDFLVSCTNEYIKQEVDGIIFSPLERIGKADEINRQICDKIDEAGIPIVLVDRDICNFPERSKYDLVSIDNYSAGFIMGQHLINQGCKKTYFFHRPFSAYSVQQRISGVNAALRQMSMEPAEILCGEPNDIEYIKSITLAKKSGIICANDSTAAILMSSLDELGYVIGKDIIICGYDNMKYGKHLKYPLTSYWQPCEAIAKVSVELLLRRISTPNATTVSTTISGGIIQRESSLFVEMPEGVSRTAEV